MTTTSTAEAAHPAVMPPIIPADNDVLGNGNCGAVVAAALIDADGVGLAGVDESEDGVCRAMLICSISDDCVCDVLLSVWPKELRELVDETKVYTVLVGGSGDGVVIVLDVIAEPVRKAYPA